MEYLQYNNPVVQAPMTFDLSKAVNIFSARIDQGSSFVYDSEFRSGLEVNLKQNELLIFTLHGKNGQTTSGGVTYEFAENI